MLTPVPPPTVPFWLTEKVLGAKGPVVCHGVAPHKAKSPVMLGNSKNQKLKKWSLTKISAKKRKFWSLTKISSKAKILTLIISVLSTR